MATYVDMGTGIRATGSGCNMSGAYAADQAGGWGYLTQLANTNFYHMAGHLYIGDGSTDTTWTDTRMSIKFDSEKDLRVFNKAVATFGEWVGSSNAGGSRLGCQFQFNTGTNGHFVMQFDNGSTVYFYGCQFMAWSWKKGYIYFVSGSIVRMWECNLSYFYGLYMYTDSFDFRRCNCCYFNYGMVLYKSPSVMKDIHNVYAEYGAYPGTSTIERFFERNNDFSLRVHTGNAVLVNADLSGDPPLISSTGSITDKVTWNIKVVDENGDPINGATVRLTDSQSNVTEVSTDVNGNIPEQTLTRGTWTTTSEIFTDYNPYTVKIKKAGYQILTYKKTLANDNGEVETVALLSRAAITSYSGSYSGGSEAGTDDITATGSCNIEDLFQYCLANNYMNVERIIDDNKKVLYKVNCKLIIGDGATATTWTDTAKAISFAKDDNYIIEIKANASATFTYCQFNFDINGSFSDTAFFANAGQGVFNFNYCIFKNTNNMKGRGLYFRTACTLVGCIFDYWYYGFSIYDASATITDCYILNCYIGLNFTCANNNITRLLIKNCTYSITSNYDFSSKEVTIENSGSYDFASWGSGKVHILINSTTPDKNKMQLYGGSYFYSKITYIMKIVDINGTGIDGATVTFTDSQSNETQVITAGGGLITEQTLIIKRWYSTGETETDYNPYIIKVEKSGYVTKEWIKTIDNTVGEDEVQLLQTPAQTGISFPPEVEGVNVDEDQAPAVSGGFVSDPLPPGVTGSYIS